ncbi:MAG: metal-dependent hydrolase [Methanolobus sp.]|uniref:metal-dependent hydrolase n=1 Tax=Methanolobus sp. TaxID=1874737 RepID=UPI002731ABDC|nr:metal-dependent hydrolase [Methanolobus sp.]MDP2217941.1 metal-dependent hydrolase [Methanolobus sp.]
MPYPIGHVLFFMFCVFLAGVLVAALRPLNVRERLGGAGYLVLLMMAGGLGSLFPDVPALWNYFLHGNLKHVTVGPVPTHSLFFGMFFFLIALMAGYIICREWTKALSVGLFAAVGFISHLMLDDLAGGSIYYLYPFYSEPFSVFYQFFV